MDGNLSSTLLPTTITNSTSHLIEVDLMMPSALTLCSLTMIILVLSVIGVFLYYFHIGNRFTLDSHISVVLVFLGGLLATITAVGTAKNQAVVEIYRFYIMIMTCFIGLLFTCVGSVLFFESGRFFTPEESKKYKVVGHHQGNLGIVIWIVTLPLVALELLIIIGAFQESPPEFLLAARVTTTIEKLVQAGVYYFSIRHRYPKVNCIAASKWFFQILSLYNFILWVDSIMTTTDDDAFLQKIYGSGFAILKSAYNALIIDYRMLCALLFLEHGFEIGKTKDDIEKKPVSNTSSVDVRSVEESCVLPEKGSVISLPLSVEHRVSHYSGAGYILGICMIFTQVLNGLQYLNITGSWANISGIAADCLVILFGGVFLKLNNLNDGSGRWRESDSKGIDAMVGIMGGVGFTFWIIKSFMSTSLASYYKKDPRHSYLIWTSLKNCVRATGVIFQLYLFTQTEPSVCTTRRNRKILGNHFLVPALMLCLFAVFVTAIVDQYHGEVEVLLHHSRMDASMRFFLEAADPIHLAFCLHMFLHFLIVRYRMVNIKVRVTYMMEDTSAAENEDDVDGQRSTSRRGLLTPLLSDVTPHMGSD